MLEMKHVSKIYDRPVIDDINLTLEPGKIYVLKGASGSGKSTLLHILGGLDREYAGDVYYNNDNLKEMNKKQFTAFKNEVGYVFQDSLLIPQFSVLENFQLFCNDNEKILQFAKRFHIADILDSKPVNLSNGERQRISIIRTLLLDPSIILMDEPTAALDQANAQVLKKEIAALKNDKQILLISTHDVIFDDIADVILTVSFGKLNEKMHNLIHLDRKQTGCFEKRTEIPKKTGKMDLLYCLRKYKKIFKNSIFLCLASSIFLFMFLSFSFKFNFSDAYEHKLEEEYPFEMFQINKDMSKRLTTRGVDIIYYNNYQKKLGDFAAVSYFPKKDSSLSIPSALSYGRFPERENEVIVNEEYISNKLGSVEKSSVIGTKIIIEGNNYTIAGILTSDKDILRDVFQANVYYWNIEGPLVFMSETAMQSFVEPKEEIVVMAKLMNEKLNAQLYQEITQQGATSYFYRNMSNKLYAMNQIFYIAQICIFLIALMTFIFMYFVIQLDLFYRKRELGYLQILHIQSSRVKNLVRIDYLLKVIPALCIALLLYCVSIFSIQKYMNFLLPYDIPLIIGLLFFILLYVILVVEVPLRVYMKKDVLSLIRE